MDIYFYIILYFLFLIDVELRLLFYISNHNTLLLLNKNLLLKPEKTNTNRCVVVFGKRQTVFEIVDVGLVFDPTHDKALLCESRAWATMHLSVFDNVCTTQIRFTLCQLIQCSIMLCKHNPFYPHHFLFY